MQNNSGFTVFLIAAALLVGRPAAGSSETKHPGGAAARHSHAAAKAPGGGRLVKGHAAKSTNKSAPAETLENATGTPEIVRPGQKAGVLGQPGHGKMTFTPKLPRLSPPPAPTIPLRDAIGVPVVRHQEVSRPGADALLASRPQTHSAGVEAGSVEAHGPANTGAGAAKFAPPSATKLGAAGLSSGRINGTFLARRGLAPASLGGPAKPVGSLNGTTIAHKR